MYDVDTDCRCTPILIRESVTEYLQTDLVTLYQRFSKCTNRFNSTKLKQAISSFTWLPRLSLLQK